MNVSNFTVFVTIFQKAGALWIIGICIKMCGISTRNIQRYRQMMGTGKR
jgi:hypothetical protein